MDCTCNEVFAEMVDDYPPTIFPEVCATCGKRTGVDLDGITLKACAQCRVIKYCSRECQRKDWPDHKLACQVNVGKGSIKSLMRAVVCGHPLLTYFLNLSASILHGLDGYMPENERKARIRSPLYMQMDVGVEPTDINEMIRLCQHAKSYDYHSVEGMLQIHRLSVTKPVNLTLSGAVMAAKETRDKMNAMGDQDYPLVMLNIINSNEVCMQFPLFLTPGPMPRTDGHDVFLNKAVRDGTIASPIVADYINHVNEHIRADKNNLFSLRTKMRQEDKKLIVDALRGDPYPPAVYCRQKIMREPRYKPLWDLFERKKEYVILESTAQWCERMPKISTSSTSTKLNRGLV